MAIGEQLESEQARKPDSAASEAKVRAEKRHAKPPRDERREVAQSLARERWAEWARNKAG
jgi:hypothetical protein